ncbi:MAG: prepilin-type N-terminal cleavage/methylation domain-containing protein [Gemmatimonadota bacterium]
MKNPVLPSVEAPARAGFTMVEIIIAIVILTMGLLGLAGSTGYLVRTVTLGDLLTERTFASQTIIDRLQSLPYANVVNGTDTIGVFAVDWDAVDDGPQSKILTVVTVGPGLSPNGMGTLAPAVADTFVFRVLRP